jgi:N-methylhydantoinase B
VREPHGAADQHHSIRIQGFFSPLHGFCGGCSACGNFAIVDYEGEHEQVVTTWTDTVPSPEGEQIFFLSGGGGGWGNPLERDPELVRVDVLDELVSVEGALWDYGVVLDPDRLVVDPAATADKRQELEELRAGGRRWTPIGRRDVLARTGFDVSQSMEDR